MTIFYNTLRRSNLIGLGEYYFHECKAIHDIYLINLYDIYVYAVVCQQCLKMFSKYVTCFRLLPNEALLNKINRSISMIDFDIAEHK